MPPDRNHRAVSISIVRMDDMATETLSDEETRSFRGNLLPWFRLNARDLPWRRTRDPYSIWVSEVMLQQTRVATVIDRYTQFMQRFPSLVSLALAREEDVLALWSGLGYYKRARMLHGAAQLLLHEHGGSLPKSSADLRRLPGVGDYTAAAVASIAHGEPAAVLDGNVERVLLRVLGGAATGSRRLSATRLKEAANLLLDPSEPGIFNQAMMELGAMVCLPRVPLCASCPVQELCRTRGEHTARPRKQMVSRKVDYALVRKQMSGSQSRVEVLLVQRPADASQMPGMWELPMLSSHQRSAIQGSEPVLRIRHSITNTNYYVAVFSVEADGVEGLWPQRNPQRLIQQDWIPDRKLGEVPLTGLARKILMRLDVLARPTQVRQGKVLPGMEGGYF
ncbi:MAG: A/G-specific adenine glycosylase [Acidobacteriaceae bacterium]